MFEVIENGPDNLRLNACSTIQINITSILMMDTLKKRSVFAWERNSASWSSEFIEIHPDRKKTKTSYNWGFPLDSKGRRHFTAVFSNLRCRRCLSNLLSLVAVGEFINLQYWKAVLPTEFRIVCLSKISKKIRPISVKIDMTDYVIIRGRHYSINELDISFGFLFDTQYSA